MTVFLLVLILCLSGLSFEAEATKRELNTTINTTRNPFGFTTWRPFTTGRNLFRFTTRRPFPTRNPFSDRHLRCFSCLATGSIRNCLPGFASVQFCQRNNMCMFAKGRLRRSGQTLYVAGCVPINEGCQRLCDKTLRSGSVTRCSIRCCNFRDFCNGIGPPRTPFTRPFTRPPRTPFTRPFTTRLPITRHRVSVRVLLKVLKATKNIIKALTILLESHMNDDRARGFKREVVSMMSKVDFNAKQLEDSNDPEALRLKLDVSQTRMQAQAVIKKLDEIIDKVDPNAKNNEYQV